MLESMLVGGEVEEVMVVVIREGVCPYWAGCGAVSTRKMWQW